LKDKVKTAQKAVVDYEQRNSIVNVSNKESVAEQKLADLNHDLTQAQSDRMEKESIFALAISTKSQVGTVAQNNLLQKLEEQNSDLREQYVDALAQFGEAYPKVTRLREQLNELQTLIERDRKQTIDRLHNDFKASKAREALLSAAVAKQKTEVGRTNQLLIQHNILKREFETNQRIYDNLLQRLKDASVSAGLRATNIHLVDEARPTVTPVRPRKIRNSAIGLLAGLILGFLAATVAEVMDHSIKSAEEVERLIAVPALAIIPSQNGRRWRPFAFERHRSAGDAKLPKDKGLAELSLSKKRPPLEVQKNKVELAVLHNPGSAISESFRGLRTSILLPAAAHRPQTILVTSPLPSEGKTCVSLNLGFALAQMGSRVLVLDADFRKPGIASSLKLNNDIGLSNVLTHNHFQPTSVTAGDIVDSCLRRFDILNNLWVLPTGASPPNPAELLASPTMNHLLDRLRHQFDHIILDSPPVLLLTDALILSSQVDGVLIVVENEKTARGALQRACRVLTNSGGRILGVVLNRVDTRRDGYYGHYSFKRYDDAYEAYTKVNAPWGS